MRWASLEVGSFVIWGTKGLLLFHMIGQSSHGLGGPFLGNGMRVVLATVRPRVVPATMAAATAP